jgi:hypothetical protein
VVYTLSTGWTNPATGAVEAKEREDFRKPADRPGRCVRLATAGTQPAVRLGVTRRAFAAPQVVWRLKRGLQQLGDSIRPGRSVPLCARAPVPLPYRIARIALIQRLRLSDWEAARAGSQWSLQKDTTCVV